MSEGSKSEIEGLKLEGMASAVSENIYKAMALRSRRYDLAHAGHPIKSSDLSDRLISIEAAEIHKLKDRYNNFKFPSVSETSDEQGKPDQNKLHTVRMALTTAPILTREIGDHEEQNIRDFRAVSTSLQENNTGRIVFADGNTDYANVSYDPEKLLVALAADSQDPEEDYTIISYPHLNPDRTIQGVTALVMTKVQRDALRDKLIHK